MRLARQTGLALLGSIAVAAVVGCGSDDGGAAAAAGSSSGGNGGTSAGKGGSGGAATSATFLPEFESGSRLSVRRYEAGDMPPVFLGFYDNELETDCAFTDVAGTLRCLPATSGMVRDVLFADATCSESVGTRSPTCGGGGEYLIEQTLADDFCAGAETHISHAVALDSGAPLYAQQGADCVLQGAVDDSFLFYRIEAKMPLEDFVSAEKIVEPAGGALTVRRIDAADGTRATEAIYDSEKQGACRVYPLEPGWMCVPEVGFHSQGYRNADAACSQPLSLGNCTAPLYLYDVDQQGNDVFYAAGEEYTGDVYGGTGGMCELVTDDGEGTRYFAIGAPASPEAFASLSTVRQGSGRLQRDVFVDEGGALLMPGGEGIFDTELESFCTLRRDGAGQVWCLPEEVPTESTFNLYYADAGCTEQLALCGDHGCPHDVAVQVDPNASCGNDFGEVLGLGEEFTGAQIYFWYSGRPAGEECDGSAASQDFGTFRHVTGAGTLAKFAELELVTE
jgi:hypothetical protein